MNSKGKGMQTISEVCNGEQTENFVKINVFNSIIGGGVS